VRVEEGGVGGRDDDVGVGHEVETPAGADAVDGGDHRLPDPVVPRAELQLGPLRPAGLLPQRLLVAGQLLHVEAGLEGRPLAGVHDERLPLAGVDDHPHRRVGVELLPRPLQLGEHRGVHGVAGIGPVEHQPADVALPLHEQRLVSLAHDRGTSRHGDST
jgi:hypothetical protein